MGPNVIAIVVGCVLALVAGAGGLYWHYAADPAQPSAAIVAARPADAPPQSASTPATAPPVAATTIPPAPDKPAPPAAAPVRPAASAVAPSASPPSAAVATAPAPARQPTFDIVRIEPTGETLVAGRAAPAAAVALLADGRVVAQGKADDSGAFVLLPGPLAPGAHALALQSTAADGARQASAQEVAVEVPKKADDKVVAALQEPNRPTVLLADPTAAADPAAKRPRVSFKTAEVQTGQSFFATGEAAPGGRLRLYLNGSVLKDLTAGPDGRWSVAIGSGVSPGRYVLRGDALDAAGKVIARAEVPFTAPDTPLPGGGETPPPTATATAVVPTIQTAKVERGDSLWEISRKALGDGLRYTRIYAANSSQIRDPNLIYPGQVFVLPTRAD